MITSPRERGAEAKQDSSINKPDGKTSRTPSSSRQWTGFGNPRIVRVSQSFGGKDRHSKVCTVRGLRDRRIRLSVPTAIQLYDLQDRLGLSQPSKVIDWLIEATENDIDKLPPLQMPQGFGHIHQDPFFSHYSNSSQSLLPHWDVDAASRGKSKVEIDSMPEKMKWINTNQQENHQEGIDRYNSVSDNSYYNWNPSSLSLSQHGAQFLQTENPNTNAATMPSSLAIPSGSQLFFSPSTSLFSPYAHTNSPVENDTRNINNIQSLSSSSQHMFPYTHSISFSNKTSPMSVSHQLHHSQSTDEKQDEET